ncbi:Sporulation lipoprotein YhcN/YlaJ (Spore_YhcN_YlaJ) [Paenibacillus sp. UNCCL117]|uniref:YhcN/YlaJ family sporulation lipoprotein n=1 Tax=unclassified Paenibacillus TaxID=185978 RepID=UPI0008866F9C|nr:MULTISPECIES: YhcN/YlaJ family sporulation lipoprotein [unclassified Paenibacillus]SDC49537.1 Sporulation lipoprotein YhcN/YlaJ (Spore_YhcN_YlaJ) [Paenibacillus sp. cl123]SFW11741.1 Sporulation lipoprotein YhcN/YlaJ (Spore_YhcN_YlaJ) [Paenibacillus sp. UNCCL117]
MQIRRTGKAAVQSLALAAAAGLLLTGCSGNHASGEKPGAGLADYRQQAVYDRDSRNNEDQSLGVKDRWIQEQENRKGPEYTGRTQLDMTNRHLAGTMAFDPGIAAKIAELPGVQAAQVLLTEVNAYVAVVLDGHNPDEEANPDTTTHRITEKGGAGLFGTGQGTPERISWTESGGLAHSKADEIRKLVLSSASTQIQDVYVSANPNFVQRVRLYAREEKNGLTPYMNEFNTMIQHVFPDNVNTRK